MKKAKAIFLDFDGVILESVDVKGWVFSKLFENHPEHVDEIVAFHYANGGMSRFEKFHHIYENIFKEPLPDNKFNELCRNFFKLAFNRVLKCDFVPGALEFLKKHHKRFHPFIISGTPHEEINKIIEAKGLSNYFEGVFGAPTTKSYWARKIIEENKLDANRVLFIGDAMSDYEVAEKNNIMFVARITDGNDIFKDKKVYWKIRNFFELEQFLNKKI
jgi:phosphoglycolate phosphatase-like HAD superfamily hydrolase